VRGGGQRPAENAALLSSSFCILIITPQKGETAYFLKGDNLPEVLTGCCKVAVFSVLKYIDIKTLIIGPAGVLWTPVMKHCFRDLTTDLSLCRQSFIISWRFKLGTFVIEIKRYAIARYVDRPPTSPILIKKLCVLHP
jgi:hypothetical protein